LNTVEARDLFNTILILDGIEQGEFIDKEKASELFMSYFHEDINEIIGENPLPMGGRYDIAVDYRNSKQMRKIVRDIRHLEGVDVASFQQGIISRVDSIVENILGLSMAMGIAIFIIAVILVSNTIRLIIHAKQETIETMHLLGATNSFIRFPFVVEGIIQGILGAGFSLLILFLLRSLQTYLLEPLIKLPLVEPANLIAYNFIFGLLLALFGSYRGISKYLPK
jgi:cell division transport system permease protein